MADLQGHEHLLVDRPPATNTSRLDARNAAHPCRGREKPEPVAKLRPQCTHYQWSRTEQKSRSRGDDPDELSPTGNGMTPARLEPRPASVTAQRAFGTTARISVAQPILVHETGSDGQ
ncbi:hypothetical protein [Lentzea sp. NEAU-D7]|uniref:hypothetical protein n=1 Tax=Lentzea sp. NEAU-D7 TaxID=2994667 RepID=UPI00224B775F|nr:hypothetical protein [Lentzea sp. NEAU-D7]MCX2948889.1 hypothetical protein [Lentzea sp. NEAU-D7]